MNIPYVSLVILFVFTPVIIIYLEGKYKVVKKIGAVLLCYILGAILGNIGVFPKASAEYMALLQDSIFIPFDEIEKHLANGLITEDDKLKNLIAYIQNACITYPIGLALPLILFSLDVKKWLKNAKPAFESLAIGLFTVLVMIFAGYFIFLGKIDDIWKVSGLLVGVYTGGTPNMAAIKAALDVSQEIYILTHTYEMLLGAIYLVFIFSVGQRVFLMFLPAYKSPKTEQIKVEKLNLEEDYESYDGIFSKKIFWPLLGAFGLSVAIMGISGGISFLFPEDFQSTVSILLITSLGIAFSFIPRINRIKKTFQAGMYLILIFCLAVASLSDVSKLANISVSLFYYVGFAMFGSHILHAIIARFFKIDADTVIISGSALICSPPFVPVVAGVLKNREIILTGMVVGIAGYAVGNYLGVAVAYLLR